MGSWFKHGSEKEDREEGKKGSGPRAPMRLWLNPEEEKRIIVLDDTDFCIWEHHVKVAGKWGNFFTCVKDLGQPCPLCMSGSRRQMTGFVTVVDCTGFKGKDGKWVRYRRALMAMPATVLDRFVELRSKKTSLVGAVIDIKRTTEKAPRLGDVWEIIKLGVDVDKDEKLFYKGQDGKMHPPEPFDYEKLFEPKTGEELQMLASGAYAGDESYKAGGNYQPPDQGGDDDALY